MKKYSVIAAFTALAMIAGAVPNTYADEITEIHLTYKHPKLETLIGKMLPQIKLTDMSRKSVKMD